MLDCTPVCNKCGKVAPVDEKMSTPEWVVHRVKEPCECGGKFLAKFMVENMVENTGKAVLDEM